MIRSAILAGVLALGLAAVSHHAPEAKAARHDETFKSNGRIVRITHLDAGGGGGRRPAVLMLHGASGLGRGWLVWPHAEAVAADGMHAYVVNYFDGLPPGSNSSSTGLFEERDRIILDAVDWMASQPEVDPRHIGIYGLSLGGFHALSLARRGSEIGAVVALGSGLSRHIPAEALAKMPPVLLLHGAQDDVVPFSRALEVAQTMEQMNRPFEMKVYRHMGHVPDAAKHEDTVMATADFLRRKLASPANQLSEVPVR